MVTKESMKLYIAADHAGVELKSALKEASQELGVEFEDLGTHSTDSVNYPEIAHHFTKNIVESNLDLNGPCGVLICGSGIGVSITANRNPKIRAALVWRPEIAELSRQHNNANVLCLPARFLKQAEALEIFKVWLNAKFEGGRHQTRVEMI